MQVGVAAWANAGFSPHIALQRSKARRRNRVVAMARLVIPLAPPLSGTVAIPDSLNIFRFITLAWTPNTLANATGSASELTTKTVCSCSMLQRHKHRSCARNQVHAITRPRGCVSMNT